MRRLTRSGALLGAALLGLTAAPALSATYADADGGAHPYVVLLTFYADVNGDEVLSTVPVPDGDDEDTLPDDYPADYMWRCTGTLLSPTLVLTAGHCVVGAELAHVYNNYDSEEVHPALTVAPPSDDFPTSTFVTGTPHGMDAYDDLWPDFPQTFDVGVIVLDEPIDAAADWGFDEYPTLVGPGTLDEYSQRQLKHDVVFETVGYGLQWIRGPWLYDGDWVRHRSWSTWVNDTSRNNTDRDGSYNIQTSNNKGHTEGGSCFGDSGGPVFLDDRADMADHQGSDPHQIVAVVSYGMSPNCTGVDFSYRVDQPAVQEFIWSHASD